jgi:hypothetical protein
LRSDAQSIGILKHDDMAKFDKDLFVNSFIVGALIAGVLYIIITTLNK